MLRRRTLLGGEAAGQRPGGQAAPAAGHRGRALQVDPIKPALKPPGSKRLELIYDGPLSKFAFNFKLRRYSEGEDELYKVTAGPQATHGVLVTAGILLFAQSVPVHPYTLAASSSLALHGVHFSAAQSSVL